MLIDVTSVDLALAIAEHAHHEGFAWLDGSHHPPLGRWSFVAACPQEWVTLDREEDTWSFLRDEQRRVRCTKGTAAAPRWIGFLSFDHHHRDYGNPHACFARYRAVYRCDHQREPGVASRDLMGPGAAHADRAQPGSNSAVRVTQLRAEARSLHIARVQSALEQIREGQVYQVNLARRWSATLHTSPWDLYLAMRDHGPVPYGAYLHTPAVKLLSRSMETFLHYDAPARVLTTRPIKGTVGHTAAPVTKPVTASATKPVTASATTPADATRALRSDPKEQAEHAMVIDLMRNDLGRIAEPGTVHVQRPWTVEPHPGLHHMVSTVQCRVRPHVSTTDILQATMPPGSVTGTPKHTALRAIRSLESSPRGVYTGAIGYLDTHGGFHFSVAIRTAQVYGRTVYYHAGGGIVEGSDPERETDETELKARVFLDALQV
jgi:anthranilate/para-aminobenzoate synthase component I